MISSFYILYIVLRNSSYLKPFTSRHNNSVAAKTQKVVTLHFNLLSSDVCFYNTLLSYFLMASHKVQDQYCPHCNIKLVIIYHNLIKYSIIMIQLNSREKHFKIEDLRGRYNILSVILVCKTVLPLYIFYIYIYYFHIDVVATSIVEVC